MNYNKIAKIFKPLLPANLRTKIRNWHQHYIFNKQIESYKRNLADIENNRNILSDLIYGWGNLGWSAMDSYLLETILNVRDTPGRVLECGSGLSTILMGIMADKYGGTIITLEHQEAWATKLNESLKKHNIKSVQVKVCPIKSYGDYDWYDVTEVDRVEKNDLVVCDGPPSQTKGGRHGLMPVFASTFKKGTRILMDDFMREDEKEVVRNWSKKYNFSIEEKGKNDLYAILIWE